MDIRSYLIGASTSKLSSTSSSSSGEDEPLSSDAESLEPAPPIQVPTTEQSPSTELNQASGITIRSGKRISCGGNMTKIIKEHSAKPVEKESSILFKRQVEHGLRGHSRIGRKRWRRCVLMQRVMLIFDMLKLNC